MSGHHYAPVGKCIYCGENKLLPGVSRLGDEYIMAADAAELYSQKTLARLEGFARTNDLNLMAELAPMDGRFQASCAWRKKPQQPSWLRHRLCAHFRTLPRVSSEDTVMRWFPLRLFMLCVLALSPVSVHADSGSPDCRGQALEVTPPSNPYESWATGPHEPGTVFDLRGIVFHLRDSSNPDPDGICRYSGAGYVATNRYPIVNPGTGQGNAEFGTKDACFRGGSVLGEVSLTADFHTWVSEPGGYCNSAAMDLKNNLSTHQIVEGIRIDRVWDGIRFNGVNCQHTPGLCSNIVRDVWISHARDDCIENDGLGGLTIQNSLLDGCFSGISSDPGSCTICPPPHANTDVIHLSNVLIRMQGYPYTFHTKGTTGPGQLQMHHVGAFKIHKKYGPELVIENSVIAFEFYIADRHESWKVGWSKIKSCSNNYLLWLPDTPFPSVAHFPTPPSCFKILTGAAAREYWHKVRSDWIDAHPNVARLPGDPPSVQ